jgi:hypothetical protein
MGSNLATVAGFCTFVITDVRTAPDKDLTGFLRCQIVVPSSGTGGGNFGSRAALSRLAR